MDGRSLTTDDFPFLPAVLIEAIEPVVREKVTGETLRTGQVRALPPRNCHGDLTKKELRDFYDFKGGRRELVEE